MKTKSQVSFAISQLGQVMIIGLFFGVLVSVVAHFFVEGVKALSSPRLGIEPVSVFGLDIHYSQVITLSIAAVLIYIIKKSLTIGRWQGPADTIYGAHRPDNELDVKVGLSSTLVAFISASGGASVGQYGPLVHFGAVIGSACKRFLKIDLSTDVFIGCGVAAAISAGFNAPIAGVVFAHEAILRHFSLRAIAPIAIASCVATGTSEVLWPGSKLFELSVFSGDLSRLLPIALILGPIFGLVAVALMQSVRHTTRFVASKGLRPEQGLCIAVLITSIGGAFVPEALGLGGSTVDSIINLEFSFGFLLILLLMKIALTTACLGFGLFGGIFSPSLLVGAAAGALALYVGTIAGLDVTSSLGIIICGMAAVSSSVIGAPIAGVMIVLELTGSYEYALVAMISIVTSVLTSHFLFGHSFFDRQLADRGIDIAGGRTGLEMMERSIATILHQNYTKLVKDMTAKASISKMLEDDVTEAYVLDKENLFLGKVTLQSLLIAKSQDTLPSLFQIDPITIKSDASLQQAMEVAVKFVGESIPIIDRDRNQLMGVVTEADLFKDYLALQNKIVDLERR
jgi:chloride channel protein, CIC family